MGASTARRPTAGCSGSTATRRRSSPTQQLREENASRGRDEREYELGDTGVLDEDRFFDVLVTYAKAGPDDICITVTATNHGPDAGAAATCCRRSGCATPGRWGRDKRRSTI